MNKQQEIKLRKLIRKQLSEEFLNEDWRTEKNKWSSANLERRVPTPDTFE